MLGIYRDIIKIEQQFSIIMKPSNVFYFDFCNMKGKEIPFKDYAEKETIAKHCKTEQTENETFIDNNKASFLNTSSTKIWHSLRLWICC